MMQRAKMIFKRMRIFIMHMCGAR